MNFTYLSYFVVLSGLVFSGAADAKTFHFKGELTAKKEIPHAASVGKGHLTGTYNTETKVLKWRVPYRNLTGKVTMAHFHGPASAKENADVTIPIAPNALVSPISGSAKLTAEQAKQLLSGHWYFNIHTEKFPGGEIRTQMIGK